MTIGVLGPLHISGRPTQPKRERVVLSVLTLHPRTSVPPDRLAAALWGDDVPPSWRKVVQGAVVRLRRQLGADVIETTPGGYRLLASDAAIDARQFQSLIVQSRQLEQAGDHRGAANVLRRALALWRGDPFGDLEDWPPGAAEIRRLHELRRLAEERLLQARLRLGEHQDVAADAAAFVESEPLREQLWAVVALAQYRSGRQGEALRSLARARTVLADECGVSPGPELVVLEQAILAHDPRLAVR